MKKHKLLAVLGAAALTLSVAGVALAEDLNSGQVGNTLGSFTNDCEGWPVDNPVGAGQIGVHFVLTTPDGDATSANLTAAFSNPSSSVGPVANTAHPSTTLHFYVVITGDGNTTIDSASTDVDGGNLNVSHVCAGASVTTPPTEAPSATPTFGLETAGITDAPSEPTTDTIGSTGTSGPADGAWMLVVALGVLLASIVVLTPARAKR
ncbi:MAG TPA: hypothetical protein VJ850_00070 [Candidatus Limnocylindrales bacterium]|nr:hypothetical protein [Candidatus Limnocylindrales bacterium]